MTSDHGHRSGRRPGADGHPGGPALRVVRSDAVSLLERAEQVATITERFARLAADQDEVAAAVEALEAVGDRRHLLGPLEEVHAARAYDSQGGPARVPFGTRAPPGTASVIGGHVSREGCWRCGRS